MNIFIDVSPVKNKKYRATVKHPNFSPKHIDFGDNRYEHYEDTALGEWKNLDHKDDKRRKLYYNRFSGTDNKKDALVKEFKKSKGQLNAKILSHIFLW